jgi:hypothetical protein
MQNWKYSTIFFINFSCYCGFIRRYLYENKDYIVGNGEMVFSSLLL